MLSMATMISGFGFQDIMESMVQQNDAQAMSGDTSGDTPLRKISRGETIHSGHFMVSEIDESEQIIELEANESRESDFERPVEANDTLNKYDLETNCKETTQTYYGGPFSSNKVSIDGSLTKLFECMSLAYSGKITSPRWKSFKGLKLNIKDKIRLNNIIWRAWHIQYIAGRNPIVCQFSSPVDSDRHKKVEAVIMEGKYWKRHFAAVIAEYNKWRLYNYQTKEGRPETPSRPNISFDWENCMTSFNSLTDSPSDDYMMDFTDPLFAQLFQPNMFPNPFPNPREIARSGMGAEFMQPGLTQLLQSNIDDVTFMDTFEPELFFPQKNMPSLPTLQEETNIDNNILVGQQNAQINQSISEMSSPELLNALFGQSNSRPPSNQMSRYSMDNKNLTQSMAQTSAQTNRSNSDLHVSFKLDPMPPPVPQRALNQSPIQSLPAMNEMNAIQNPMQSMQSKPMLDSIYTQYGSPVIGAQNSVPFSRSQPSVHTNSRSIVANEFAQSNNTSYSHSISPIPQHFGVKSSPMRKKYTNSVAKSVSSPEASNQKFVSPKSMANKQRSRERSISTPHINREAIGIQTLPLMSIPTSAVSMTNIYSPRGNPSFERSSSLPLYTQERRKGVVSMPRNANFPSASNSGSVSNISYPLQQSLQPMANKLQMIAQNNMNSYSAPQYMSAPQMVVSNPYDMSQGSTSDSTLIARLLTSNSLNNISNDNSQQMYSTVNPTAAQNLNLSNNTSERPTTIDASCIGIRSVTNTDKTQLFSPKLRETDILPIAGQLAPNIKPNFVMQSNPNICSTPSTPSMVSIVPQMPSLAKSHSSPVSMSSYNDKFASIQSIPSPPSMCSPTNTAKPKTTKDRIQYKEHRRVCHINAEQKRRCNIKNGFDTLKSLLPSISQSTNTKISKAAMLQKAAEHIRQLKSDRHQQQEEYDLLIQQVDSLNQTIGVIQSQMPATGVPVSSQRSTQTQELYENYIRERTLQNWKFWIFNIIMKSLWESYNQTVTTSNMDEMSKTIHRWIEHNCCLIQLRKDVLNSLRFLSTSTNILTDPKSLPDEAILAVTKKEKPLSS